VGGNVERDDGQAILPDKLKLDQHIPESGQKYKFKNLPSKSKLIWNNLFVFL
jgi:hypothetical protein